MTDNNQDSPAISNFSIEDTMDLGIGSTELLKDLYADDSATSAPDDLEKIVKEVEDPKKPAASAPKGKTIDPIVPGEEDNPVAVGKSIISNFLGDNSEGSDEDIDDNPTPKQEIDNVNDGAPDSKFTALSNDLFKLGVFNKDEDETDVQIKTPEDFLERFNLEKRKGSIEMVNNFIAQFGEDYQDAFDAIFVNGADPREYFGAYNRVVDFAEMDLTHEGNQEAIVRQALTDQGLDREDVASEIERLKNYGDLESVATKHHKVLVRKEAARLKQIEQESSYRLQQKAQIRNQYINNVQSVIADKLKTREYDGIPITPKIAEELHDFLLVDKWRTESGETLSDFDKAIIELKRPENHGQKVKLALLMKVLEKDPTLSTIQKTGVTKQTNALFGEVARQVTKEKSPNVVNNNEPRKSWFDEINK